MAGEYKRLAGKECSQSFKVAVTLFVARPLVALTCQRWSGRACPLCPGNSDINLFRAGVLSGGSEIIIDRFSGLLRQFEPDRLSGLLLSDGRAIDCVSTRRDVFDL
jgi:hypothetical protein